MLSAKCRRVGGDPGAVMNRPVRGAMLLLSVLCSAAARAQEPADWIEFPGASAELVPEAVFGGRVMLYQAGRRGTQVPGQVVVLVHGLS